MSKNSGRGRKSWQRKAKASQRNFGFAAPNEDAVPSGQRKITRTFNRLLFASREKPSANDPEGE
jgi:hypothetical protein